MTLEEAQRVNANVAVATLLTNQPDTLRQT
jgi:hypothetical protein